MGRTWIGCLMVFGTEYILLRPASHFGVSEDFARACLSLELSKVDWLGVTSVSGLSTGCPT